MENIIGGNAWADKQDESKYTDEDKEHMRKVVSYCKRHLAQEEHLKQEKSEEELEQSKSTRSLKNWVSSLSH
jgi:hypothetical protein